MKKLLLFGFEDLPTILALEAAVHPFGAELVSVPRNSYGQTLASLAEKGPLPNGTGGAPLIQRMLVLCGLEADLDALLPALASAGAGSACLKAILTRHNRNWNAFKLLEELQKERRALKGNQLGDSGR